MYLEIAAMKKRAAYQQICRDIEQNGLSHAYLVLTDDEDARETFFRLVAMRVLCTTACGSCVLCRATSTWDYSDFAYFDGRTMKVKDVVALTESISVKPVLGEKKLYFLDFADKLSPQAQNKLLKTYEEPPSYATMFLGASNENGLLATVRSRGKLLSIDPFTTTEVAAILVHDGEETTDAAVAAAYGGGNLAKARAFVQNENVTHVFDNCFDLLLRLNSSAQLAEFVYGGLFTKETILMSLDFLEIILCDVMKTGTQSGAKPFVVGRDFDLNRIANKYSPQSASMAIFALNEGRKMLASNINSVSVAENVLYKILEARYLWQS